MAIVCTPSAVYADNSGPNSGDYRKAALLIWDNSDNTGKYLYKDFDEAYNDEYDDCKSPYIDGFTYDKTTNTLYAEDGCYSDYIIAEEMGEDFKITLLGECAIMKIISYGGGYSGSVTIDGYGDLYTEQIALYGENTNTTFTVKRGATVEIIGQITPIIDTPFLISSTTKASDAVVANCNYKLTEQKQQIYSNKTFYLDGVPTFVTTAKKDGKTYYVKTIYDSKGYSVSNDVYTLSGKNLKLYESLPATDEASFNKLYEKYDIVIDTGYNYGCTEYETIVFNGPESFGIDNRKGTIVKCVGLEDRKSVV